MKKKLTLNEVILISCPDDQNVLYSISPLPFFLHALHSPLQPPEYPPYLSFIHRIKSKIFISMSCQMPHNWAPACLLRLSLLPHIDAPATQTFFCHLKYTNLIFCLGAFAYAIPPLPRLLFHPLLASQLSFIL